ncbi:MAG: GNAT family protein [candidate division Zixibacteria bacterium]|nr:GNAT family protein [candidate division Zixibacteria bacterium]
MLLKSRDIYLRFLRKTDAAYLFAAVEESRHELDEHVTGPLCLHSIAEAEHLIERAKQRRRKRQGYYFGIFSLSTKQFIGYVNLHGTGEQNRSAEVGYWVRTSQAGKGIATTATALIVLFGFKELKLHRIVLLAAFDNPASWRVAEKMGFVYDGVQRHEQHFQRGWVDLKCYSMLETEFRQLKPKITKLAGGKKD